MDDCKIRLQFSGSSGYCSDDRTGEISAETTDSTPSKSLALVQDVQSEQSNFSKDSAISGEVSEETQQGCHDMNNLSILAPKVPLSVSMLNDSPLVGG